MARGIYRACNRRCFSILKGSYNHTVLGDNVADFLGGLAS
jgi:hypothetical protein